MRKTIYMNKLQRDFRGHVSNPGMLCHSQKGPCKLRFSFAKRHVSKMLYFVEACFCPGRWQIDAYKKPPGCNTATPAAEHLYTVPYIYINNIYIYGKPSGMTNWACYSTYKATPAPTTNRITSKHEGTPSKCSQAKTCEMV